MNTSSLRSLSRLEKPGLFAGVMIVMMAVALIESFAVMSHPSPGKIGYVIGFALALLVLSYGSYRLVFLVLSAILPSRAPIIFECIFWLSMLGSAIALIGFPLAQQHSFPANYHVFATVGGAWAAARTRSLRSSPDSS